MQKFIGVGLLVLMPILGWANTENTQDSAQQLLSKMQIAMHTLNYYGTVTSFKQGRLQHLQFSHNNENGKEVERVLILKPMRKMIREASKVSTFFKSGRVVVDHQPIKQTFLLELPKNLEDISNCYFIEYGDEATIAGLAARIVVLRSKDNFRYSRKIWVDKKSFLPLKFELIHLGISLEQTVFTQLEIKEDFIINPLLAEPLGISEEKKQHIHRLEQLSVEQASFAINKLPNGFRPVLFTRRAMAHSKNLTEHLVLNDGFSSVSIYFELKNPTIKLGQRSLGSLNAISRLLADYHLTVMGEVPIETVKMIAENIVLKIP